MLDRMPSYIDSDIALPRSTIIVAISSVLLFSALTMTFGYQLGKKTTVKQLRNSPTPSVIYPSPSTALFLPSIKTQPTTTPTVSLQSCLDKVQALIGPTYQAFCGNWKRVNNSEGCPGYDFVTDPIQDCYKLFGQKTVQPTPLQCLPGWIQTCDAGKCECRKGELDLSTTADCPPVDCIALDETCKPYTCVNGYCQQ